MARDDDEPVAGSTDHPGDMGAAMSPPERHSRFTRNRTMVAAMVIAALAFVVVLVLLVIR